MLVTAFICNLLGCGQIIELHAATKDFNASERNEKALLRYLWPVLKSSGKVGRVYYQIACQSHEEQLISFPQVIVKPPIDGHTGYAAIRDIFRDDKRVSAVEDESGVVRIRIGNVPDTILGTKISALSLSSMEQYNYAFAIGATLNAPEVQTVIRQIGFHRPSIPYTMLVVQPSNDEPHVLARMTNVSVDHELDAIAAAFKGIIFYGICPRSRLFNVFFVGGVNFDDRSLGAR